MSRAWRRGPSAALCGCLLLTLATGGAAPARAGDVATAADEGAPEAHGHGKESRLTDQYIPLQLDDFPRRPRFLLELGNPYLGTGNIGRGITLPTGAVWQPTLILFGNLRTALQSFENDGTRFTEWANRLDLFANLQLSGTERLVVGFRNLDREGRFTSYVFAPDTDDPAFVQHFGDDDSFREELNAEIQSLFFEGDFGEIFPRLSRHDFARTDVGFSVGRQPLVFQDGMLIDDSIDALGVTRNTLLLPGTSNFRATLLVGANDVHRGNVEDESAELVGILTSTDLRRSTIDADLVFVRGDAATGDLLAFGLSAVQRLGQLNSTFRLLGSSARDQETVASTDGALLFSELSWTPHATHDLFYVNTFMAVDEFSSAARGPATGGPLGRAGINFAAVGLGNYGAPLSSRARDVAGGAVGYQKFFGVEKRRQLLTELGLRAGTRSQVASAAAVTVRYQTALGRRLVVVLDAFSSYREGLLGARDESGVGGRVELLLKF